MKDQQIIEVVEANENSTWINSSYGNFCPLA